MHSVECFSMKNSILKPRTHIYSMKKLQNQNQYYTLFFFFIKISKSVLHIVLSKYLVIYISFRGRAVNRKEGHMSYIHLEQVPLGKQKKIKNTNRTGSTFFTPFLGLDHI